MAHDADGKEVAVGSEVVRAAKGSSNARFKVTAIEAPEDGDNCTIAPATGSGPTEQIAAKKLRVV